MNAPWFESAADLLSEADPGPTPFLVDDLIVESAIAAVVGPPKLGKTWLLLDLAIAIVTGESALGRFAVSQAGPVLVVLEESGRAALHRRLRMLARGRDLAPASLRDLHFAANRRVRLNDDEWKQRLVETAAAHPWRLIAFDPFARVKGAEVEENSQREIGPVLDFMRDLREASSAAITYVHHTPHNETRQRGSSDLESYWESKLTITVDDDVLMLRAEHREAEAVGPIPLSASSDASSFRLRVGDDPERVQHIEAYLREHPDASDNEVRTAVGGKRQTVLAEIKVVRERLHREGRSAGGSHAGNHREPPPRDLALAGGSPDPLSPRRGEGSGTAAPTGGSDGGNRDDGVPVPVMPEEERS